MNKKLWEIIATSAGLGSVIGLGSTIWKIASVKSVISTDPIWMWSLVYIFIVWMLYGFKIKSFALWFTDLVCLIEIVIIIILYYTYC